MKTAFVLACVFGAALAVNYSDDVNSYRFLFLRKDAHDSCQANPATHVDNKLLHHLADNIDNPKVGAHMLCESKAVGLQKPNGELDLAVVKQTVTYSFLEEAKIESLVKECAVKKKTPEKTGVNLFICLEKNEGTYLYEFYLPDLL